MVPLMKEQVLLISLKVVPMQTQEKDNISKSPSTELAIF